MSGSAAFRFPSPGVREPSCNYTVHATTAVKDVGGNDLASEFISTFTTANPQVRN
jgi:hypothetical protein